MQNEHQFSNLIYDYFLLRICFRYYKYGDFLPPIKTLCQQFCVSSRTIKAALKKLRSKGYISMHNGQMTKVIYQQSEEEFSGFIHRFYSERGDSLPDLFESGASIFVPLLIEGIRRMDEKDIIYVTVLAEHAVPEDLTKFYCFILQKLENPLVMNLFWETAMFQGFLFVRNYNSEELYDAAFIKHHLLETITRIRARDWEGLYDLFYRFQKKGFDRANSYIRQNFHFDPAVEKISFTWRIYRDYPQLCYSLTLHMLHDIYLGEFRNSEFLPSYEKMAAKYGVSVSTMRRTVQILHSLGATQTINGKGTRIFSLGEHARKTDFASPAVRRNLAFFFQSFEIMIVSCEKVTCDSLSALSPDERGQLIGQLETCLHTGRCDLSLWSLLISIAKKSPLQGIREIYGKLYGLFLWGYPLKASSDIWPEEDITTQFTKSFIEALREDHISRCGKLVKELVSYLFPIAETYLSEHGIQPEELRMAPAIRLLLTE